MSHPAPRVPLLPVVSELLENGSFGRIILVEDKESIVDAAPGTLLEFPVVGTFEESVKSSYDLFEGLVDWVNVPANDARMRFGDGFREEDDASVGPHEVERILEQP